ADLGGSLRTATTGRGFGGRGSKFPNKLAGNVVPRRAGLGEDFVRLRVAEADVIAVVKWCGRAAAVARAPEAELFGKRKLTAAIDACSLLTLGQAGEEQRGFIAVAARSGSDDPGIVRFRQAIDGDSGPGDAV